MFFAACLTSKTVVVHDGGILRGRSFKGKDILPRKRKNKTVPLLISQVKRYLLSRSST